MPLADDLLAQAKLLANLEAKRPKQSSLRRAVSTAYYGLFHLLIDAAVKNIVSGGPTGLDHIARRAYQHGEMKAACIAIGAIKPSGPSGILLTIPVSDDLKLVAGTFVSLYESRRDADYNLGKTFNRSGVLVELGKVDSAFKAWGRQKNSADSKVFLLSLLMNNRWNK